MPDEWAWYAIGCGMILAFGYAFVSVLFQGLNRDNRCPQQMTTEPVHLLAALAIIDKELDNRKPAGVNGLVLLELRDRITQGIDSYRIIDNPGFEYKTGDRVRKTGGDYTYSGWVVSAFRKRGPMGKQDGPVRYVVEDGRGLLMIMNGPQLNTGAGN